MGRTRNLSNLVSDNIFSISSDGGIALGGGAVGISTMNVVGIISTSGGLYGDAPNASASGQAAAMADSNTSFTTTGIVTTTKELVGDGKSLSGIGYTTMTYVMDRKSAGTNGGVFVDDSWQDRVINYTLYNDQTLFTSTSTTSFNITQSGKYYLEWYSPSIRTDHVWSRLYNITDSAVVTYATKGYGNDHNWYNTQINRGAAVLDIDVDTQYKIQAYSTVDDNLAEGYGARSPTDSVTYEEYTIVKIYKLGV